MKPAHQLMSNLKGKTLRERQRALFCDWWLAIGGPHMRFWRNDIPPKDYLQELFQ